MSDRLLKWEYWQPNPASEIATMAAVNGALLCLAYILGLLSTAVAGEVRGIPMGAIALLTLGGLSALLVPRFWRTGPRSRLWLVAGVIGFLAVLYFQWRVPKPEAADISALIANAADSAPAELVEVRGEIETPPRLTRSQRITFELRAIAVKRTTAEGKAAPTPTPTTGNLYVTVPLLQGTGLYPGQIVVVSGSLYKPKPASNPGGFDFQHYLAQQGIFAGLNGKQVRLPDHHPYSPSLWWSIRRRIIQAQVEGLGVPEGPLVSAMVMGKRAVDVPYPIQDQFRRAGLSHALAASGAQVSMLVGVVLVLTQRLSGPVRIGLGTGALALYVGLTGLEAAVLRAGIMGFVALLALAAEREVKPLGSLLLTAVLLLLFNPIWVWDLGFQLSFLATLGLLVTVPVLTKWLDWLPAAVIPLLAVPIAAYLWTLPLQLFAFGLISVYSIPINIAVSPLIPLISIGGMVSALAALIYPPAGSFSAWLLHYPTAAFIKIAELGSQLPGNQWAIGTLSIAQVLLLYGLGVLVWWQLRLWRYWWVVGLIGFSLVAIPAWYTATHLAQVTILATAEQPMIVIQDRGKVGLIGGSSEAEANYSLLPFLQKQGVNQIDWAIAAELTSSSSQGWGRVLDTLPIQAFYTNLSLDRDRRSPGSIAARLPTAGRPANFKQLQAAARPLAPGQTLPLSTVKAHVLKTDPWILEIHMAGQTWLLLGQLSLPEQAELASAGLGHAQVMWWSGQELSRQILGQVKPKVAIASSRSIGSKTEAWLYQQGTPIYLTSRDGAVQWTPKQGFATILGADDEMSTRL